MISLGGALGCNARYIVSNWVAQRFDATFPYGTFMINVSGSFFLGLLMAYLRGRGSIHPNYRLFFATGFAGGFTTFSTFMYESLRLLQDGNVPFGFLNVLGSIVAGLLGVFVGFV